VVALNPITSFQVWLQMFHRLAALGICVMVALTSWRGLRSGAELGFARRFLVAWPMFIAVQITLGAATIWTNKSADVATAHVAVGALTLVTGLLLALVCSRVVWRSSVTVPVEEAQSSHGVQTLTRVPA